MIISQFFCDKCKLEIKDQKEGMVIMFFKKKVIEGIDDWGKKEIMLCEECKNKVLEVLK